MLYRERAIETFEELEALILIKVVRDQGQQNNKKRSGWKSG